jgi:hypothetical protein
MSAPRKDLLSGSEFDETVSLVYVTNLNDHLGVLKDAESHQPPLDQFL